MTPLERRRRRRRAVFITGATVGVVVLLTLVSYAMTREPSTTLRDGSGRGTAPVAGRDSFDVSGSVTVPLEPGTASPIDVEVDNAQGDALSITELEVTVRSIRAPRATTRRPCTVDDFRIEQVTEPIPVAAGGTVSLSALGWDESRWPLLRMLDTSLNQDGCVGAELRLDYRAVGQDVP